MRRKLSIIGILLLAFCVSGWGSALAAALSCPHAKGEDSRAMAQGDHSCCHAKLGQKAQADCSKTEHEAMGDMQPTPSEVASTVTAEAAGQPARSCARCMEQSEIPATPNAFQANQLRRSVDAASSHTQTPPATFAAPFTPQVLSRQGSPPGAQTRKHLLISIFLI